MVDGVGWEVERALPARVLVERLLDARRDRQHVARVEEVEPQRPAFRIHARIEVARDHAGALGRDQRLEVVDEGRGDRRLQEEPLQRGTAAEARQTLPDAHAPEALVEGRVLIGDAWVLELPAQRLGDPLQRRVGVLPFEALVVPLDPARHVGDRRLHPGDGGGRQGERGERGGGNTHEGASHQVERQEDDQELRERHEADLGQPDAGRVVERDGRNHDREEHVAPRAVGRRGTDDDPEGVEGGQGSDRPEDARQELVPGCEIPGPVDRGRVAELRDERQEPEAHEEDGGQVHGREIAQVRREALAVEQKEEPRSGPVDERDRVGEAGEGEDGRQRAPAAAGFDSPIEESHEQHREAEAEAVAELPGQRARDVTSPHRVALVEEEEEARHRPERRHREGVAEPAERDHA